MALWCAAYCFFCGLSPAWASHSEFCHEDTNSRSCVLNMPPTGQEFAAGWTSHRSINFVLGLKPDHILRSAYFNRQGVIPSSATFRIAKWEVFDVTNGGFTMIASGGDNMGSFVMDHGGAVRIRAYIETKILERVGTSDEFAYNTYLEDELIPNEAFSRRIQIPAWCEQGINVSVSKDLLPPKNSDPADIYSLNSRTTVNVKIPNMPPLLSTAYVGFYASADGGGHEGSAHHSPRPAGTFGPTVSSNNKRLMFTNIIPGRENLITEYLASEFGGVEGVSVVVSDKPLAAASMPLNTSAQQDAAWTMIASEAETFGREGRACQSGAELKVQIPGLVKMADQAGVGTEFTLTGGRNEHHGPTSFSDDNNHYLIEDAAEDLAGACFEIRTAKWNQRGEILRLNDMSLGQDDEGFGGGFDINGNWGRDFVSGGVGHVAHRTGIDVDIENRSLFINRQRKFEDEMCHLGWHYIPEPGTRYPHFRYEVCP